MFKKKIKTKVAFKELASTPVKLGNNVLSSGVSPVLMVLSHPSMASWEQFLLWVDLCF